MNPEEYSVSQIVETLQHSSDQYYNNDSSQGLPLLSDAEWDLFYRYLQKIDPANEFLVGVGSEVRSGKVELPYQMPGLDQVHQDEGGIRKWIDDNGLNQEVLSILDKLDGNSGMLVYDLNGELQIAYSRGTSTHGQDLTRHLLKMKKCPQRLEENFSKSVVVRVEFEMEEILYDKLNRKGLLNSRDGSASVNARQYVSGQLNSKDATQVFYDNVDVVAYELISPIESSKARELEILRDNGFTIAGAFFMMGEHVTDEVLTDLLSQRHKYSPYALDGLVVSVDYRSSRDVFKVRKGSSLNPVYARKFKVGQEQNSATTEVVAIHRQVSASGYIKPKLEIKPVELMGVCITYVTAYNEKFLSDNKLGPGAVVEVVRSGDVIPKIVNVISPGDYTLPDPEEFGEYSWSDANVDGDQIDLVLNNISDSNEVELQRLVSFFTKIGVEFLGEKSLRKLYASGYTAPEDIINAPRIEIQALVGAVNGAKIMKSIQEKLSSIDPWTLAGATKYFGRGVGRQKMKKVFEVIPDMHNITVDSLVKIDGIEEKTAKKIVSGLGEYSSFLNRIENKFSFAQAPKTNSRGAFSGWNVVFTGVRDKEVMEEIERRGGFLRSSISSKVTLVVAKDATATSSKLVKARELGIEIIDLTELRNRIY